MNNLSFLESIKSGTPAISIGGLWGSSKAYLASIIRREIGLPSLFLTSTAKQAEDAHEDFSFFLRQQNRSAEVFLYSPWNIAPYEIAAPHREIIAERLTILDKLLNRENIVVVASVEALMQRTLPRAALNEFSLLLGVGEEISRQQLTSVLVSTGYKSTHLVENRGEFSIRGGVIDIFPPFGDNPIRIEFFGDEIASLRAFDVLTQRSTNQFELINVLPGRELVLFDHGCRNARHRIRDCADDADIPDNVVKTLLDYLEERVFFPGIEWYAPYLHGELDTLLDYLPERALMLLDEPVEILEAARKFETTVERNFQSTRERGQPVPEPTALYLLADQLETQLRKRQQVKLHLLDLAHAFSVHTTSIEWAYTVIPNEKGVEDKDQHIAAATKRVQEWVEDKFNVIIAAYTESQAKRIWEILQDYHVPARVAFEEKNCELSIVNSPERPEIVIVVGVVNDGFVMRGEKFILLNEDEFLGKRTIRRRHAQRKPGKSLMTLGELELNDYIVHVDHGIGVYLGLKKISVQNITLECLHLEYSGSDKLYVPVDRLDLVQKYKGADQRRPKLDKLGGTNWARVKERVKASVEKMAQELMETYAARQVLPGVPFTVDEHVYREFEASFEYEETPDQAKAITDVARDMASPKPMDRLICGDVGYGKTEVAMRAAFLSVLNGKQVAILVPTTLLAQQHYQNFTSRFAPYPVNIGLLSRFRTKKEQQEVVHGAKDGTVDIVIGTHRLLQKDISFKDIGLVIIDEEQRFGVTHKERIRQYRKLVDVLTLTATPIPRTLHMSLMGVRDLSIIETAPEGRLSVRTYVMHFDDDVIYEAVTREMERGGQVFFIHNKIETIDGIALRVSRLLPHVRIAVAHGQMHENDLENVMLKFINKEIDVLISTTIVESGLDIPSVNTLIINRAHEFGLSQLYQLRGRIGRSKERAYAYLLVPDEQLLTSDAKKRLRVIQELSELGSGFKLAAHDLEIRGAGNLLGAEQTGHIAALGFDMYCRVIEQTVHEIKGQPLAAEFYPQIDMKVSAHFPEEYIPDMQQRLEMYKRLMSSQDFGELLDVEDEIRDRYGALPDEAQNIVALAELKLIATQLRIQQIQAINGSVTLTFDASTSIKPEQLRQIIKHSNKTMYQTSPLELIVSVARLKNVEKINHIKNILQGLR